MQEIRDKTIRPRLLVGRQAGKNKNAQSIYVYILEDRRWTKMIGIPVDGHVAWTTQRQSTTAGGVGKESLSRNGYGDRTTVTALR